MNVEYGHYRSVLTRVLCQVVESDQKVGEVMLGVGVIDLEVVLA